MVGDESVLKALKAHRIELDNLIYDLEANQTCYPKDVRVDLLLTARECLASARTEEKYFPKSAIARENE